MRIPPGLAAGLVIVALLAGCAGADPACASPIRHGLADHSDRYAGFAERLVHAGYAVWAFDMRGHGRSAGVRVRIDRVDDLRDDLDAFVALVADREPGRPIVLHGHSLGGLATPLYAIERHSHHPQVTGVVLAAPGIAFDAPPIQASAIRRIAALAPDAPGARHAARPVLERPPGSVMSSLRILATTVRG